MIESLECHELRDQEGILQNSNSANSASVQKAICRSLPDWDNFLVELVEFCNSTNTKHKCEHNIGRFLLKYFYKYTSVNRSILLFYWKNFKYTHKNFHICKFPPPFS